MKHQPKFKPEVFRLAVAITAWNHAPWTDHSENPDCFAHNIIEQAKKAGFHVEKNFIRGTLEARPRYKESRELSDTINFITHSRRKSHTTSKHIRDKRKYDRQRAFQWNVSRYRYQYGLGKLPTNGKEVARYTRYLRNIEHDSIDDITHYAAKLTEAMKNFRAELAARMNYPDLVIVDLTGRDVDDLPF